jgi:ubiquinone/menaquinone biosynthesis C-methylase UbiE
MREINKVKYYDVLEIVKMFTSGETEESITTYFESEELKGKKIEEKWYATKEDIVNFVNNKEGTNYYFTHPQEINLNDYQFNGRILDIGGGGEGIIGQFKGSNVVSIDFRKSELDEALEAGDIESLKIIMDAKDLKFLDSTFDTITAFFSIMYMPKNDHKTIFKEVFRVLKEGGEFLIWDPIIPKKKDKKNELFAILMKVQVKNKEIITGYGTRWNKEQDISYFIELTQKIGFKAVNQKAAEEYFFLRLQKT